MLKGDEMLSLRLFVSILSVVILSATAAHSDPVRLGAQSLKKLFPGHYEARVKGYKILFSAHRGGKLVGQAFGRSDRGKWFVKGRRLCMAWQNWTKGKVKCGSVSRQNNWYIAHDADGQVLLFRPASVLAASQ